MSHLATLFDPPDNATAGELRLRLRALADLVARAPVPIAVAHDADCRLVTANEALARLLGVPADANISLTPRAGEQPLYHIQHRGRDLPTSELPMQYAIAHRTHVTSDIEIVRADGSLVYIQNDVEPLYDSKGQVCGCVSVCVDVTERKRVEDVLRESDRRKDEFLATLSHELRNPLAPIRNAVEVMRRAGPDAEVAERALAIMERQLQQLVHLTDDLLDMSRITHGAIELQRDRIDLRVVLRSAVESIQPLSDAAYTDRGGHISLSASVHDGRVTVTLTDTGIGIDPAMLPRIFDMFVQIDQDVHRAGSGLGIGLALAKRLVELHGGTIEARSGGLGTGTTFAVGLPLMTAAGDTTSDAEPPVDAVVACRVLVAEDIPDAAEMMRLMLETMGHAVRVAADGVQAVAIAQEFEPQVALLDIGMPRMDGYEAARRIRAMLGQRVYLVALTGWGQEEDERRALAAGFDRHVTKPAEPELLESLIASAVGSQA
ncbi:MAG: hypothetical protein DMF87_20070 [Acidobacteria bacterium]|nr:MAG: hypothetical protein DMF87_20070 [Acidobacteriota bacterium]